MGSALGFALSLWMIPFSVCILPGDQPGCMFRPETYLFFAYNANLRPQEKNWLCDEPFEERLRICIDVYQKTSQGKVKTSYRIVKDEESVSRVCEKRKMTFTQEFESDEPEYVANDTIRNTTIEVNMFACPITKMELEFPVDYLKPELFDMYISLGRNDVTIAALRDSMHVDNICVRNVYIYPPKHLRSSTPRPKPFWPEEIRDYKHMNDEYFEKLANKLYSRKMATATGEMFEFYSTILDKFTIKQNSTTVIPETTISVAASRTMDNETADSSRAFERGSTIVTSSPSAATSKNAEVTEASTVLGHVLEKTADTVIPETTKRTTPVSAATLRTNNETADPPITLNASSTAGTTLKKTRASRKTASKKTKTTKLKSAKRTKAVKKISSTTPTISGVER